MNKTRWMAALEKAGLVAMAWALKWDVLDEYETPWLSTGALILGSLLFVGGELLEEWLRKRYPNVNW